MKINKYIIGLGLTFSFLFAGCDSFLDPAKDGKLGEEDIWNETRRAFGFLNDAYNKLPSGYNYIDNAMLAAGCDEAVHSDVTSDIKGFNNGTWDSYFLVENVWSKNYEGIRIVNRFLERIDDLKMPVKPTVSGTDEQLIRTRERMKGEAFFLRAYFYFELIKRYGGVPLFTKSLTVEEAQQATRASYDDCMKQIIADCDSAANRLPEQYKGSSESVGFDDKKELGRPTTGAAYGLKSRALLYWASPLNNPGNDKERYKRSADAAQLVVKSAFRYKLMNFTDDSESFTDLYAVSENFLQYHREIVFSTKYNNTVSVEQQNSPLTMGGKGLTNPTQNLADAFGMANGKGINEPGSGYDEDHPYVGRDPRFYMTFAYDGSEFTVNDKTQTIETFEGGKDATATNKTATKTGYYLKKLLSPQAVWDGRTNNITRTWILMRYAEVLLNYAEAMNEYCESPSQAPNDSIYKVVELIRKRAELSPYKLPAGLTKEEMREVIRNERRVELAFEEHRFFDIRRWRLLDDPQEKADYLKIEGMQIVKDDNDEPHYSKYTVENRVFDERMYLYPIPKSEILRAPGITQNPGW